MNPLEVLCEQCEWEGSFAQLIGEIKFRNKTTIDLIGRCPNCKSIKLKNIINNHSQVSQGNSAATDSNCDKGEINAKTK